MHTTFPPCFQERCTLLYNTRPSSAAARDRGQKAATGDILFFFDDDVIIPETYIEHAVAYLTNHPSIMAVGGIYVDATIQNRSASSLMIGRLFGIYADGTRNKILPSGWADYARGESAQRETQADWLFGCNMVVRSIAWHKPQVGFETSMEAWSFLDDVFFGKHLLEAWGDCIRLLPQLKVIHAPPSSGGRITPVTVRMRILHRFIFWREHCNDNYFLTKMCFLWGMVANFILLLKQERRMWIVQECVKAHRFIAQHPTLTWEQANAFIFAAD